MTDNEIIKALECCINDDCDNCPDTFGNCEHNAMRNAFDLIKRKDAEIERLKKDKYKIQKAFNQSEDYRVIAKSEAIKEFANEFIKTLKDALYGLDIKEKTISKEEVQKRFELLMHKDIPEVIEYVKNKMVGDEK